VKKHAGMRPRTQLAKYLFAESEGTLIDDPSDIGGLPPLPDLISPFITGNMVVSGSVQVTGSVELEGNLTINEGNQIIYEPDSNYSVFITEAERSSSEGNSNTFIGRLAGKSNTTGASNTNLGMGAGQSNTDQSFQTNIGAESGRNSRGKYNTAIGAFALKHANDGSNLGVGYRAGRGAEPVAGTGSWDGASNCFIGTYAGVNVTNNCENNTLIGTSSGENLNENDNNTVIGSQAMKLRPGGGNTYVGYRVAYDMAGTGNVVLGNQVGEDWATRDNTLAIGNDARENPLFHGSFSDMAVTINGDLKVTGNLSLSGSTIGDFTVSENLDFDTGSGDVFRLYTNGSYLYFRNETDDYWPFTIKENGKVGIGYRGPEADLDIREDNPVLALISDGATADDCSIQFGRTDLGSNKSVGRIIYDFQNPQPHTFKIFTSSRNVGEVFPFVINASGNVGIGVLEPTYMFHLRNNDYNEDAEMMIQSTKHGYNAKLNFSAEDDSGDPKTGYIEMDPDENYLKINSGEVELSGITLNVYFPYMEMFQDSETGGDLEFVLDNNDHGDDSVISFQAEESDGSPQSGTLLFNADVDSLAVTDVLGFGIGTETPASALEIAQESQTGGELKLTLDNDDHGDNIIITFNAKTSGGVEDTAGIDYNADVDRLMMKDIDTFTVQQGAESGGDLDVYLDNNSHGDNVTLYFYGEDAASGTPDFAKVQYDVDTDELTISDAAVNISGELGEIKIDSISFDSGSTKYASKKVYTDGWDMNGTGNVAVLHGLADHTKIRDVFVGIVPDVGSTYRSLVPDGYITWDSANINIYRYLGGAFDNVLYGHPSSPANRGIITIWYEE
jgi:hypothetical protein